MPRIDEYVVRSILSSNQYIGNNQVLNLKEISFVEYSTENFELLKSILHDGKYETLATLPPPKDLLGAELYVVRFNNEKGMLYYGIYYDSIELYQDPEIMEIIPAVS